MSNRSPNGESGDGPSYTLRVFRVEQGTSCFVRTLSPKYGGLFVHWWKGRSVYCSPDKCDPAIHKTDRYWKGYAAVEGWDETHRHWLPVVLEITEHLELDFRFHWHRGQVWKLERQRQEGRKKTSVKGTLCQAVGQPDWPKPFDLIAVLKHLYHVEKIELTASNPLPCRVIVSPSLGDAPTAPATEGSEQLTAEDWAKFKRHAFGSNGTAEPHKNGSRHT